MMPTILHLLRDDLQRLAPWWLLHVAFLVGRGVTFEFQTIFFSGARSLFLAQELAAITLLAALVYEQPTFGPRVFWRTRPIGPWTLLAARGLFAALVVWLPRVVAQLLAVRALGLEVSKLWWFVAVDVASTQAVWIATLLALVNLGRHWAHWLLVPVAAFFVHQGFDTVLRQASWIEVGRSPIGLFLSHGLLASGLVLALALFYLALFRRERILAVTAALGALIALVAPVTIASTVARAMASEPPVVAPEPLEIEVRPRIFLDELQLVLEPRNLDPRFGLRVEGLEAQLTTRDGTVLHAERQLGWYSRRCSEASRAQVLEFAELFDSQCGTLTVSAFDLPDGINDPESLVGSLELQLDLTVFEETLDEIDYPGVVVQEDGFHVSVLRTVKATSEGSEVLDVGWVEFFPNLVATGSRRHEMSLLHFHSEGAGFDHTRFESLGTDGFDLVLPNSRLLVETFETQVPLGPVSTGFRAEPTPPRVFRYAARNPQPLRVHIHRARFGVAPGH